MRCYRVSCLLWLLTALCGVWVRTCGTVAYPGLTRDWGPLDALLFMSLSAFYNSKGSQSSMALRPWLSQQPSSSSGLHE